MAHREVSSQVCARCGGCARVSGSRSSRRVPELACARTESLSAEHAPRTGTFTRCQCCPPRSAHHIRHRPCSDPCRAMGPRAMPRTRAPLRRHHTVSDRPSGGTREPAASKESGRVLGMEAGGGDGVVTLSARAGGHGRPVPRIGVSRRRRRRRSLRGIGPLIRCRR